MSDTQYVKSPMCYVGGKHKILDSIIPGFPAPVNNFVDLFTGGLSVGINVDANTVYANDQITHLIDMYRLFQESDTEELIAVIKDRIYAFDLSKKNRDGYLALRQQYNETGDPLDLFVLRCYSFNNQLRFNRKHEFNVPFGANRSHFNSRTEENLRSFCEAMHRKNIVLSSVDFRDFDYSVMSRGDLIYCDPPYLISDAPYHDGKNVFKDWTEDEQVALLALLDWLDSRGIFFALSNVFIHKGMRNDRLIKWSQKYHVTYIDKSYSNCSYHLKDRTAQTVEVLVTNY